MGRGGGEGEGEGSSKLMKEVYGECQKNHSASLGVYSKDGCGEFISERGGIQCVACGCHRNFHRKILVVPEEEEEKKKKKKKNDEYVGGSSTGGTGNVQVGGDHGEELEEVPVELIDYDVGGVAMGSEQSERKGRRTMFTEEQKERMRGFAERLGWRMPKKYDLHEDEMQRFCQNIGINRNTFKIWMHNQKKHFLHPHPPSN